MELSWDDEDNGPPAVPNTGALVNKWEGEDEDDDVKESWEDDEDEEKKEETEEKRSDVKKSRKKLLEEKIAEREKQKQVELEKRLKDQEEISPEEKLRMQKESDLKMALETTFGVTGDNQHVELDGMKLPTTKEEFDQFADELSKQLTGLSKSSEYPGFIESLVRNLCATMASPDIKKIKNTLENLFLEKQKLEKGDKAKKNKGKGKAKLRLEGDNQLSAYVDDFNDYNQYEDFM